MANPSCEWPKTLAENDEHRLEQTSPPNSWLVVRRKSDGVEVVSTPCVVTEDKDYIIWLLFHALKKHQRESALLSSPAEGRGVADVVLPVGSIVEMRNNQRYYVIGYTYDVSVEGRRPGSFDAINVRAEHGEIESLIYEFVKRVVITGLGGEGLLTPLDDATVRLPIAKRDRLSVEVSGAARPPASTREEK